MCLYLGVQNKSIGNNMAVVYSSVFMWPAYCIVFECFRVVSEANLNINTYSTILDRFLLGSAPFVHLKLGRRSTGKR